MFHCLIIDDEPIAVRVIKKHLAAFTDFTIVAECNNALDAMRILSKENVDLLFCDIQMPQLTGLDFIRSLSHPPKVIFTTAYRDYAIEAFELQVVDYLLKPISFERFASAIQHFLDQQLPTEENTTVPKEVDYIFLKADKKYYKVNLADILYFESLGDYVIVYTTTQKIVTKERIGSLAETLPAEIFLQIHRSFIVSINKIETVGPGFVEIKGKKLSVGRNYKPQLNKWMQND